MKGGSSAAMAIIILVNFFVFLIVGAITTFKGLDLKKPASWLCGIYGFVSGFLFGFLVFNNDNSLGLSMNLTASLQMGVIFAFLTLLGGATTRWHKRRYESMAKSLFLQYGKEDDPSLFAKLVRMLLGKYQR
jgi:hypothetical protein